jgi:hypothetical protein
MAFGDSRIGLRLYLCWKGGNDVHDLEANERLWQLPHRGV